MKRAAFFDIDGTLVKGQTQRVLARIMARERLLSPLQVAKIGLWFALNKFGLINKSVYIRKDVYKVFSSRGKDEIDLIFTKTCHEILKKRIRTIMKSVVDKHVINRDLIFAISGSISSLCLPICQEFGIQNCSATQLSIANGRYSGSWKGDILEGEAKVKAIVGLARTYELDLSSCYSYADSYSDLPMLKAVGHPIAVCPDRKLRRYAAHNSWPIIEN